MRLDKSEEVMQNAIIKLAASKYVESEGNKILEEARALNQDEDEKPTREEIEKFKKLCDEELKKQKHKTKGKKLLFYKVATAAAVLLLLVNISIVSVPAVRMVVLNFLTERHQKYTRITSNSNENVKNDRRNDRYKIIFDKEYEITYLPEKFKVIDYTKDSLGIGINYKDDNDNLIMYSQDIEDPAIHIDTEDAEVKYIDINGYSALVSIKSTHITMVWKLENSFITLSGVGLSESEMLKVARSVREIE